MDMHLYAGDPKFAFMFAAFDRICAEQGSAAGDAFADNTGLSRLIHLDIISMYAMGYGADAAAWAGKELGFTEADVAQHLAERAKGGAQ